MLAHQSAVFFYARSKFPDRMCVPIYVANRPNALGIGKEDEPVNVFFDRQVILKFYIGSLFPISWDLRPITPRQDANKDVTLSDFFFDLCDGCLGTGAPIFHRKTVVS